mgnify:CR=1 FL=1
MDRQQRPKECKVQVEGEEATIKVEGFEKQRVEEAAIEGLNCLEEAKQDSGGIDSGPK